MSNIALFTSRSEIVSLLQQNLPVASLSREISEETRIIIADGDSEACPAPPEGCCVLCISDKVVSDGEDGFVHATVESFTADPMGWLSLCEQLVAARRELMSASAKLKFARHVEELMSSPELEVVFEKVTRTALGLAKLGSATMLLHDPIVERYVVAWSNDAEHRDTGEFLPGVDADLLQRALDGDDLAVQWNGGGGMAVVPIRVMSDLIGVMKFPIPAGTPRNPEPLVKASEYIRSVTPVLFNLHQLSKNKDLAMRDDLTKAFNRRFFEAYLDDELERARRYNTQLSVIFLDLDDLKLVNNMYGHLTGSRMLQEVAKRILGAVRGIDKVVRFGGDEFCVILPQTDPQQARLVASRVRHAMTERPFHLDHGIEIPITASFGIAAYPNHALSKEDLIRAADAAMYSVKSSTKNAIAVSSSEMPVSPRIITNVER